MKFRGLVLLIITTVFTKPFGCRALAFQPNISPYHEKSPVNGCTCKGYECSCCVFVKVPKIHLNETGCVLLDYLPDEIGIDMSLTLNNRVLIEEKISLKNPPPLCVGIPHIHDYGSLCVVFYNVTYTQNIGGCVKIAAKLAGVTIEEINFGCFYYERNGKNVRQKLLMPIYQLFKLLHKQNLGKPFSLVKYVTFNGQENQKNKILLL